MKEFFISLSFLVSLLQFSSADNEKDIKATLSRVTVYPDRAQLFHETAVDIPAGSTVFKLNGLSPYIDVQSIQVKGYGEFTIMGVNHQNNYLENLEELPEIKVRG